MVKSNTKEEVYPLYFIASIPSQASGVEFMHVLTLLNPLPNKPCLGMKLSELDQSMSGIFLGPNGLDLSCEKYIMILNKLMEA